MKPKLSVENCAKMKYSCVKTGINGYKQWNLRTRDTLGLIVLPLVERLSISQRVPYRRFHCICTLVLSPSILLCSSLPIKMLAEPEEGMLLATVQVYIPAINPLGVRVWV